MASLQRSYAFKRYCVCILMQKASTSLTEIGPLVFSRLFFLTFSSDAFFLALPFPLLSSFRSRLLAASRPLLLLPVLPLPSLVFSSISSSSFTHSPSRPSSGAFVACGDAPRPHLPGEVPVERWRRGRRPAWFSSLGLSLRRVGSKDAFGVGAGDGFSSQKK